MMVSLILIFIICTVGHAGHSAYIFCPICHFSGAVCGCKSLPHEDAPSRPENMSRRTPFSASIATHGTLRPKRLGEHIVFVDKVSVGEEHFRSEAVYRACQSNIWKRLQSPDNTQASIDRFKKITGISSLSPLTLTSSKHFAIARGVALDG
jgi:hypothetical protein